MASWAQSGNRARSVTRIQMQKEFVCLLAVDLNPYQQVDLPKRHRGQLYRWPELSSSGFGREKSMEMTSVVMATRVVDVVVVVIWSWWCSQSRECRVPTVQAKR